MESKRDLRRANVLKNAELAAEGQVPEGYDSMDDWWETTQIHYARDLREDPEFAAELSAVLGDGVPRGTGKIRVPRQNRSDRFSGRMPDDEDAPQSEPEEQEISPAIVATVSVVLVVAFLGAVYLFGEAVVGFVWGIFVDLSFTGRVWAIGVGFALMMWIMIFGAAHETKTPRPKDDFDGDGD
jgi:hypothetical protein